VIIHAGDVARAGKSEKTEFPGSDVFDTPGRNFFQGTALLNIPISRFDKAFPV
jgi:hypothetical protein